MATALMFVLVTYLNKWVFKAKFKNHSPVRHVVLTLRLFQTKICNFLLAFFRPEPLEFTTRFQNSDQNG